MCLNDSLYETERSRQTRVHEKCINKSVKASGCVWDCVIVAVFAGERERSREREKERETKWDGYGKVERESGQKRINNLMDT